MIFDVYPHVTGCKNLRDLGGIKTADGKTVRHGLLIRSGELSKMTPADYSVLPGIGLIVDMRSEADCLAMSDVIPEGAEYVNFPVENPAQSRFAKSDDELAEKIRMMVNESGKGEAGPDKKSESYRRVLYNPRFQKALVLITLNLANDPQRAVLWHCSAGKDRTGIMAAVLLSLLGVSNESIIADYMNSSDACAADVEKAAGLARSFTCDEDVVRRVSRRFGVVSDWIEAVLAELDELGGAEKYYLSLDKASEKLLPDFRSAALDQHV